MVRRVLIVEDDFDIRESLEEVLGENGYETLSAATGADALGMLDDVDALPCVILLDLMMPGMDGWEFRRAQRARAAVADIPVVVLSAYRDVEQQAESIEAFAVMAKPLNLRDLLRVIAGACSA